jgi:hypothetical protein
LTKKGIKKVKAHTCTNCGKHDSNWCNFYIFRTFP